ncbi:MAG: hypothetical protein V3T83_09915, partial [Acidobacteriota bacterium]
MSDLDRLRTICECCEGVTRLTPVEHFNRPGLPALAYRVGTQARFKSSMLSAISEAEALRELGTRQDSDFTIGLIDAWAVVLDVLTFYQERILNEAYLRTAVQRRSVLDLARLIGYELGPGVAAGTLLAFMLDGSEGSPPEVIIPCGTRAQSLPSKEEPPQTFETSEDYLARPAWSELRPRLTFPQTFQASTQHFFVEGTSANLKPGDPLLLVTGSNRENQQFLKVLSVKADAQRNRTEVHLVESTPPESPQIAETGSVAQYVPPSKFSGTLDFEGGISLDELAASLQGNTVSTALLQAKLSIEGYSNQQLEQALLTDKTKPPESAKLGDPGLYALRITTAPFGNNAPRWDTTPKDWRQATDAPFHGKNWDDPNTPWPVTEGTQGFKDPAKPTVHLEQAFPEILENDWVVLADQDSEKVYQVKNAGVESVADFGLSGKATRLFLKKAGEDADSLDDIRNFKLRTTTIYTASEFLKLAELTIEDIEEGTDILELDQPAPDLLPGHRLILAGQRLGDFEGVYGTEEVELSDVGQGAFTSLAFKSPLQFGYQRDTVKIYANVVAATHGESLQQVLGSGDASQAFQRFTLSKPPLTYVSAPVPSGGLSTLELRVDGVLWHEAPSFFELGRKDRNYVLRRDDEGDTHVLFGDDRRGARLNSGSENVTASYRSGIGTPGLVEADRITLLPTKPLGVRQVTNPMATSGAQDPETRDQARENAPLTVL